MMQTMISVSMETRKKLKMLCAENDCSYNNMLIRIIDNFAVSESNGQKKEVTESSYLNK